MSYTCKQYCTLTEVSKLFKCIVKLKNNTSQWSLISTLKVNLFAHFTIYLSIIVIPVGPNVPTTLSLFLPIKYLCSLLDNCTSIRNSLHDSLTGNNPLIC